jgi:AcrR family transcriptional regulator
MSKGQETRDAILDVAVRLASRIGFNGLTVGLLATETGMSKSGLFAHFRSKEALQLATLDRARRLFTDTTIRPALVTPRGEKRLRELFDRWLDWETDHLPGGCIFITGSVEFDDQPGAMRDALIANQQDWLDTLTLVVRTGLDTGDFRPDVEPDQVAFEIQALMLGYHHSARLLRDPRAKERTLSAFESLLASLR